MPASLKNRLLRGLEQQIENSLTPANKGNYLKIVTMALRVGLNKGPDSPMASLRDSKDPVSDCALAAVNLVQLLRVESQGTMPIQAMAPAAMTLMLTALDFAEAAGIVEVDMETIVRATHIYTNAIFRVLGISPQMLTKGAGAVRGVAENPGQLELIKRRAGMVRDPRASTPVDVAPAAMPRNRAERRRQRRAR